MGTAFNPYLWPVLLVAAAFGMVGAADDWLKLKKRSSDGMSGRQKLLLQLGVAFAAPDFYPAIAR